MDTGCVVCGEGLCHLGAACWSPLHDFASQSYRTLHKFMRREKRVCRYGVLSRPIEDATSSVVTQWRHDGKDQTWHLAKGVSSLAARREPRAVHRKHDALVRTPSVKSKEVQTRLALVQEMAGSVVIDTRRQVQENVGCKLFPEVLMQ